MVKKDISMLIHQLISKRQNVTNFLCWRESIGEMVLSIKGKVSTTYAVVRLGYRGRARPWQAGRLRPALQPSPPAIVPLCGTQARRAGVKGVKGGRYPLSIEN
jgi:hypothetical protein